LTATSDKRLVGELRKLILDGILLPGGKITEIQIADMFKVSRTPVKLALRALEVEGLISKREGKGYIIVELNEDDVFKAFEVRGVLEGLAAGTLAKTGISFHFEQQLRKIIEDIDALLSAPLSFDKIVSGYEDLNDIFHSAIMSECDNDFVDSAYSKLRNLPLLQLRSLVANGVKVEEELMRFKFSNMQHRLILDAIKKSDSLRAEALMREHANQVPIFSKILLEESR